jgi:hypothetical protein
VRRSERCVEHCPQLLARWAAEHSGLASGTPCEVLAVRPPSGLVRALRGLLGSVQEDRPWPGVGVEPVAAGHRAPPFLWQPQPHGTAGSTGAVKPGM